MLTALLALMSIVLLALTLGVSTGYLLVVLILKAFGRARHGGEVPPALAARADSAGD